MQCNNHATLAFKNYWKEGYHSPLFVLGARKGSVSAKTPNEQTVLCVTNGA